jgi:type VI secretion system protein ImpF
MFAFREAHRVKDAHLSAGAMDESGHQAKAARHAALTTISEAQLRAELMRDLDLLLNTTNLASSIDLADEPEIRRSIVNFGVPDIIRITIDENRIDSVSEAMSEAILAFETRLLPDSIKVSRDTSIDVGGLGVRFLVLAEMNCEPVALPVEFVADLEMASGRLSMRKRPGTAHGS